MLRLSVSNWVLSSIDRRVTALIVPDLPTEMVIEVSKLQSVALLQLKDFKNNIVKLRGLK